VSRWPLSVVNLPWMRCIAALQTCLALLLAFLLAPFQHVHAAQGSGTGHDHSTIIHAHFYEILPARAEHDRAQVDDSDDDHATAWSLDTFTLVIPASLSPFVPSLGPSLLFVPSETFEPVEVVEQRGHDPPCIDRSIPRAPPS
jgi:hypothetical protein